MSRSGYTFGTNYNLYRAVVERSIAGKRSQAFLRELAKAMDEMPEKRLIAAELITGTGEVCTLGVVCKARGIDVADVDIDDAEAVGRLVGISRSMAAEIEFENDDALLPQEAPEERWIRMREWVALQIIAPAEGSER